MPKIWVNGHHFKSGCNVYFGQPDVATCLSIQGYCLGFNIFIISFEHGTYNAGVRTATIITHMQVAAALSGASAVVEAEAYQFFACVVRVVVGAGCGKGAEWVLAVRRTWLVEFGCCCSRMARIDGLIDEHAVVEWVRNRQTAYVMLWQLRKSCHRINR